MEEFLEILKYTLPALIVFITVYFTLRSYLAAQYNLAYLKMQGENSHQNMPIKLQAYERLLLLCERIRISKAVYRLNTPNMSVKELTTSLLISIESEFDHNQAQQLYVSNDLWNIIKLTKENILKQISEVSGGFDDAANASEFANRLITKDLTEKSPVEVAMNAIKAEAKLILNTP